MVDLVLEVEDHALRLELLKHVSVGVGGYVNVAWDPVNSDVSRDSAPLLFLHLMLDSIQHSASELVFLELRLLTYLLSILVKSHLVQFSHDIYLVGTENVFLVNGKDVTWNFWEAYIQVDINEIVTMGEVNN